MPGIELPDAIRVGLSVNSLSACSLVVRESCCRHIREGLETQRVLFTSRRIRHCFERIQPEQLSIYKRSRSRMVYVYQDYLWLVRVIVNV